MAKLWVFTVSTIEKREDCKERKGKEAGMEIGVSRQEKGRGDDCRDKEAGYIRISVSRKELLLSFMCRTHWQGLHR